MNSTPAGPSTIAFDVLQQITPGDRTGVDFEKWGQVSPPDAYIVLDKLISMLAETSSLAGKKSFLVFKDNKYSTINTEDIAYIYMQNGSATLVTYKEQQYSQGRSLDQVQSLLSPKDFFRVNRQYLVSFRAVRDVEHYFSRKLLVNLTLPSPEKLLIAKEKARAFLQWLDCR